LTNRYAGGSILRWRPHTFLQTLFQEVDLRRKRRDDRHVGLDRQRHIRRQRQLIDGFRRQTLDLIAGDPGTMLARRDILDREDVRADYGSGVVSRTCVIEFPRSLSVGDVDGGQSRVLIM
jgi:hypothetical protein